MSNGEKSSLENVKNYYLNKKNNKKHRPPRLSNASLSIKDFKIIDNPNKICLFKHPTSRNVLSYNTEDNENYNTNNSYNISSFAKKIIKRQSVNYKSNSIMQKILSISNEKNINYLNGRYENKLTQSVNKIIKDNNISLFHTLDYNNYNSYNNSLFVSQFHPLKDKKFPNLRQNKEIFQKIVSLDILGKSNINNKNQNKKVININNPYSLKKSQKIIDNLNRNNTHKIQRRYYPSEKIFNVNTEALNLNEDKKILENGDEFSKKSKINFSMVNESENDKKNANNINSYNYKVNNINLIYKPIINDVTNKNKNELSSFSKNISLTGNDKNLTEKNLINLNKAKRYFINLEDNSQKVKKKVLKKISDTKLIIKNDYYPEIKKLSYTDRNIDDKIDCKKKTIMDLKNNIQFYNKLTGNKKINGENKNKHKLLLFPSSRYLIKNEEINEEEKSSSKNSDNKENTTNSKNNSFDSYSSQKEITLDYENDDEQFEKNKKIYTINKSEKSNKSYQNRKISNKSDSSYSSEKNEENESSIKENLKEKKSMKNKCWNSKYDDENTYCRKKLLEIKSKLKKISKKNYVLNRYKKEIKNNYIPNVILENITKKIIETFGLIFLEEEETDKMIQNKLKIYDKSKLYKERLKKETPNINLFNTIKIYQRLYTQKITIKYNFNLFRVQELLNVYETHLLKLMDSSWDEINAPYDSSMELINYISHNKKIPNYKFKSSNKLKVNYRFFDKEKNLQLKDKKRKNHILKTSKYYFNHLKEIKKELHFKTVFLYLRLNILDFKLDKVELKNENNMNNTSDKDDKLKTKKYNELDKYDILSPKKDKIIKKSSNSVKKHSVKNLQSNIRSLSRQNSITKYNLDDYSNNKVDSLNTSKNSLFSRSRFRSNVKYLTYFNDQKQIIKYKITGYLEKEEKYQKYVKEKEKKLKKTENHILGLNIFKNKSLFGKDHKENNFDIKKKRLCKSRQKLINFGRNIKTDDIILKTSRNKTLSMKNALIKNEEKENDSQGVKLFKTIFNKNKKKKV